jgi:hydrogenase-1 operon protein HyaF
MTNFNSDGRLVEAILAEISGLLLRLLEYGESATIDLLGLPLLPFCIAELERRLGRGEITLSLGAFGRSEIYETSFTGVWWSQKTDESGRVIAQLIEVGFVPDILRIDFENIKRGQERLREATAGAPSKSIALASRSGR